MKNHTKGLSKVLGLAALFTYGLGDILGAGIYAVIGQIAAQAGSFTWASFLTALLIISLTALSYSELSTRLPKSGGAPVYVHEAFKRKWLSILTGWLLFCATILSMATLSQAFTGYIASFGLAVPDWALKLIFFTLLMLINLRGMKHSSAANIVSTTIEVSGLLIILGIGWWFLFVQKEPALVPENSTIDFGGIFRGAALAFFAYTGFEDMANVAEEVKSPERNIPRAMLSALGVAGIIYLSVSWTATAVVPWTELTYTSAPLVKVVEKAMPSFPVAVFSLIAIFAVANTALLNFVTSSRLLYGMAETGMLPKIFTKIHLSFRTPFFAIFFIFPIVYFTALAGNIRNLASSTSAMVLVVFSLSAAALIRLKKRSDNNKEESKNQFRIPVVVPALAILLNISAIFFLPTENLIPAAAFAAVGIVVSFFMSRLKT